MTLELAESSSEPLKVRDVIKAMAATNLRVQSSAPELKRIGKGIDDSSAAIRQAEATMEQAKATIEQAEANIEQAKSDSGHYTAKRDRVLKDRYVFEERASELSHYVKSDDPEARISKEDEEEVRMLLEKVEASEEVEDGDKS